MSRLLNPIFIVDTPTKKELQFNESVKPSSYTIELTKYYYLFEFGLAVKSLTFNYNYLSKMYVIDIIYED